MAKGNGKMYNDKYNSPDNYTDLDGNMKTFTHINYSNNPKVHMPVDLTDAQKNHLEDRKQMVQRILSLPAAFCPPVLSDFTVRGEGVQKVEWNRNMVEDEGVPFDRLVNIETLTKKRVVFYESGMLSP